MNNTPLKSLIVLADPEWKGKHPCDDCRYIATEDAVFDDGQHSYDGEEKIYLLERGSVIAKMTDCEQQARYAMLFAAAPQMLDALKAIVKLLDDSQPKDIPGAVMVAQSAILKATGEKV